MTGDAPTIHAALRQFSASGVMAKTPVTSPPSAVTIRARRAVRYR